MAGVQHRKTTRENWLNTKIEGSHEKVRRLEEELTKENINRRTDAHEKGSRVVMTPYKSQIIAANEKFRVRMAKKMRHPEHNLQTQNAAKASVHNIDHEYQKIWNADNWESQQNKLYKPLTGEDYIKHNKKYNMSVNQVGLVELAEENFLKSKQRFSRELSVGM